MGVQNPLTAYERRTLLQNDPVANAVGLVEVLDRFAAAINANAAVVVFKPTGDDNSGPVYNDFRTLVNALRGLDCPAVVYFDYSEGASTITIPNDGEGPYVFPGNTVFMGDRARFSNLTAADGVSFKNVSGCVGLILETAGATGGAMFTVDTEGQQSFKLDNCNLQGTRTIVEFSAPGRMTLCGACGSSGGLAYINGTGALPFFILDIVDRTVLPNNCIGSDSDLTVNLDPTSSLGRTQTDVSGTITWGYTGRNQVAADSRANAVSAGSVDGRKALVFTGAGTVNQTMPPAETVFGPMPIRNNGSGTVNLTEPGGGTVTPASLAAGESAIFYSDGTDWFGF